MTPALPAPREAQQLLRLRTLRVQRARERCSEAQAEVEQAAHVVHERQRDIERSQRAIETLAHKVVRALAPTLPRWVAVAAAERERLADRLERDEYALIDDEQRLEQAQERLQQERARLTRALASEDAASGLADEARRAEALSRERRIECELQDQTRMPARPARRPV